MEQKRPDLSFSEFEEVLSTAFLPYVCAFKSLDNGSGYSFQISNGDVGVLKVTYSSQRRITDRSARSVISQARAHLRERGHELKPWRFPKR